MAFLAKLAKWQLDNAAVYRWLPGEPIMVELKAAGRIAFCKHESSVSFRVRFVGTEWGISVSNADCGDSIELAIIKGPKDGSLDDLHYSTHDDWGYDENNNRFESISEVAAEIARVCKLARGEEQKEVSTPAK